MLRKIKSLLVLLVLVGIFVFGIWSLGENVSITLGAQKSDEFFPIGLICVNSPSPYTNDVTREFPEIAAVGFNVIQSYQFEGDLDGPANSIEDARAYLDAAHKSGLKVLMGIPQECVTKRNLTCVKKRVSALKDHSALFGWKLYDEPDSPVYDPLTKKEGLPVPPRNLVEVYRTIKQLDRAHPVSIGSFLEIGEQYPYLNAFDIFMSEYFPIPVEPPTAAIVPYVDAAVRVLTPKGKSVITEVQVYNIGKDVLITRSGDTEEGRETVSKGRYPTREEIRFMAYYAILRGAKGVFFNCYRFDYGEEIPGDDISPRKNPSQWRVVSSVSAELKAMIPILLTPTQQPNKAGVTIAGGAIVEMMVKQHQDKTYLFAVNPSPDPVHIQFALNQFPNPKITLLPEGQRIPFKSESGTLNAQFSSYEVRIYEIASGEAVGP